MDAQFDSLNILSFVIDTLIIEDSLTMCLVYVGTKGFVLFSVTM